MRVILNSLRPFPDRMAQKNACFSGADEWKWYDFIYPVIVVGVMIWVSLFLIDGKENENKKNKGGILWQE